MARKRTFLDYFFGPWILRLLGIDYPERPTLELIPGSGVTISAVDDPTTDATKVTITATGGGGGSGETNTASNVGAGAGVFKAKTGVDLAFKSIVAGTGVTVTGNTNDVTIAASGEANTASNVGTGVGVFKSKTSVDLAFKTLVAGTNVTITPGTNDITIAATGGASGEVNTASNVGSGSGNVYKQKTGVNLELKTLIAGTNVTITDNASDITIAASGGGSSTGTSQQIQTANGSGGFNASTCRANTSPAGAWLSTVASGTPTSTGIQLARTHILQWLNNASSADLNIIQVDSSDNCIIGDNVNGARLILRAKTGSTVDLSTGGGTRVSVADTVATFNVPLQFPSTSSYIGAGWSSGGATSGFIRLKSGQTTDVLVIDDGGGGNRAPIIQVSPTTSLNTFGMLAFNTSIQGAAIAFTAASGVGALNLTNTVMSIGVPRHGNSTPYASEGQVTIPISSSISLTAAQYSRKILKFTGSASGTYTVTLPAPAIEDASYVKKIRKQSGAGIGTITFTIGSGSTFTLPGAQGIGKIYVTPTGVTGNFISVAGAVTASATA
jgi:hypothetical protein